MIPHFPLFKSIEWNDRSDVEQFTNEFPPYSDFNFVSMWSWNTREKMKLSQLNGNLVLLFYDYVTETPFLSYIGGNDHTSTACALIEYSMQKFREPCLKLIPECVAAGLPEEHFAISADDTAHDYILSVPYLCSLPGLASSANQVARFYKKYVERYPDLTVTVYSPAEIPADACITLFKKWAKVKSLNHIELNEYNAFVRFINNKDTSSHIITISDNNTLIGFCAFEFLTKEYAIGHFLKADNTYKGINEALLILVSQKLAEHNISYWNYEQDLGIPLLRQAKQKYKPVAYLKKFTVQKIQQ